MKEFLHICAGILMFLGALWGLAIVATAAVAFPIWLIGAIITLIVGA